MVIMRMSSVQELNQTSKSNQVEAMLKSSFFYFHIFGYVSGSMKTLVISTIIPLLDLSTS